MTRHDTKQGKVHFWRLFKLRCNTLLFSNTNLVFLAQNLVLHTLLHVKKCNKPCPMRKMTLVRNTCFYVCFMNTKQKFSGKRLWDRPFYMSRHSIELVILKGSHSKTKLTTTILFYTMFTCPHTKSLFLFSCMCKPKLFILMSLLISVT